jgi:hypothetical protein
MKGLLIADLVKHTGGGLDVAVTEQSSAPYKMSTF